MLQSCSGSSGTSQCTGAYFGTITFSFQIVLTVCEVGAYACYGTLICLLHLPTTTLNSQGFYAGGLTLSTTHLAADYVPTLSGHGRSVGYICMTSHVFLTLFAPGFLSSLTLGSGMSRCVPRFCYMHPLCLIAIQWLDAVASSISLAADLVLTGVLIFALRQNRNKVKR